MSVSIFQQPDDLALTKGGRLSYAFQGDGRVVVAGVKATNTLLFTGPIAVGTVINLFWKGQNLKMVARSSILEPFEFPAGDGSLEYLQIILPYFRDYFPIQEDFDVTISDVSTAFIFSANKPGPEYNLSTAANPTPLFSIAVTLPGATAQIRERYSVYVELWAQKPTQPEAIRLYANSLETDETGVCRFDLSTTLHGFLSDDLPSWNAAMAKLGENSQCAYFLRYAEAWGEPLKIGRLATTPTKQAYWGGMPYTQKGRFQLTNFLNTDNGLRALRMGPLTRYPYADQPEFLTFLNSTEDELADLTLQFVFTLSDGSTAYYSDLIPDVTLPRFRKVTFPVGLPQIGVSNRLGDGQSVVEYSVQLLSPAGFHSPVYRYVVNARYRQFLRHFIYLNSYGSVDTLTLYGKGSGELQLFKEQAERVLPTEYALSDGQFIEYDLAIQQQVEVTTGFRPEADLVRLNDFYRSPRKFRLADHQALPIGVLSKSIKQAKDGDTTFAHLFEYAYLFQDQFFYQLDDELITEVTPPADFQPGGTVVINPVEVIPGRDDTVPDVVRDITQDDIDNWNRAQLWGNHALAGYLKQQVAAGLFANIQHNHPWTQILGKPPLLTAGLSIEMTQFPKKGILGASVQVQGKTFKLPTTINQLLKIKK